jgi:cytoskeletal protein CcmA (bactofilin family)
VNVIASVGIQPKVRIMGKADYRMIEIHLGAIVQGCLIHQMSIGKAVELKLASVAK